MALTLYLEINIPPPQKKMWQDPSPDKRKGWNQIADAITSWFCQSNGLRKDLDFILNVPPYIITFRGSSLRYLAPGFRSAISLIYKAYQKGTDIYDHQQIESTPGVYVTNRFSTNELPKPWYLLSYPNISQASTQINKGTIFDKIPDNDEVSLFLESPSSTIGQALTWFHYQNIRGSGYD